MASRTPVRHHRAAPRHSKPVSKYNANDINKTLVDRKLLWLGAGGSSKYAAAMAIVSYFENPSGDPTKEDYLSSGHIGNWQVAGGSTDPSTNARQAVKLFKAAQKAGGTGFEPWDASKDKWGQYIDTKTGKVHGDAAGIMGFHKTFLQEVATGKIGDAIDAVIKPLEPLQAIGELAIGLTELLLTPEGWRRLLKVIVGGIILLWGLNQLSKATLGVNPARGVRKVGMVAATKGAVK